MRFPLSILLLSSIQSVASVPWGEKDQFAVSLFPPKPESSKAELEPTEWCSQELAKFEIEPKPHRFVCLSCFAGPEVLSRILIIQLLVDPPKGPYHTKVTCQIFNQGEQQRVSQWAGVESVAFDVEPRDRYKSILGTDRILRIVDKHNANTTVAEFKDFASITTWSKPTPRVYRNIKQLVAFEIDALQEPSSDRNLTSSEEVSKVKCYGERDGEVPIIRIEKMKGDGRLTCRVLSESSTGCYPCASRKTSKQITYRRPLTKDALIILDNNQNYVATVRSEVKTFATMDNAVDGSPPIHPPKVDVCNLPLYEFVFSTVKIESGQNPVNEDLRCYFVGSLRAVMVAEIRYNKPKGFWCLMRRSLVGTEWLGIKLPSELQRIQLKVPLFTNNVKLSKTPPNGDYTSFKHPVTNHKIPDELRILHSVQVYHEFTSSTISTR